MKQILDCFCKDIYLYIVFIRSHRPVDAISNSYDNCEPQFKCFEILTDSPLQTFMATKLRPGARRNRS